MQSDQINLSLINISCNFADFFEGNMSTCFTCFPRKAATLKFTKQNFRSLSFSFLKNNASRRNFLSREPSVKFWVFSQCCSNAICKYKNQRLDSGSLCSCNHMLSKGNAPLFVRLIVLFSDPLLSELPKNYHQLYPKHISTSMLVDFCVFCS